jgi:hypothetical protein
MFVRQSPNRATKRDKTPRLVDTLHNPAKTLALATVVGDFFLSGLLSVQTCGEGLFKIRKQIGLIFNANR